MLRHTVCEQEGVWCPGPLDCETWYRRACWGQCTKTLASDNAVRSVFSALRLAWLEAGADEVLSLETVARPGENAQAVVKVSQAGNPGCLPAAAPLFSTQVVPARAPLRGTA